MKAGLTPPELVQPAGFATQRPRAFRQCCPVPRSLWVPAAPAVPLPTRRRRHPARPPLIRLVGALLLPYCSEELPGVPRSSKVATRQYLASRTAAPGHPSASSLGGTQRGCRAGLGCRVGGRGWVERPRANDQRSPAPHRTEQTDFPYSALRTHSSGSFPCRRARQCIESILRVQAVVGVGGPQPARAGVFAPNPPT